jgi:hypothetical protein
MWLPTLTLQWHLNPPFAHNQKSLPTAEKMSSGKNVQRAVTLACSKLISMDIPTSIFVA